MMCLTLLLNWINVFAKRVREATHFEQIDSQSEFFFDSLISNHVVKKSLKTTKNTQMVRRMILEYLRVILMHQWDISDAW